MIQQITTPYHTDEFYDFKNVLLQGKGQGINHEANDKVDPG